MKNFDPGQRARRLGTALFLLLLSALPVQARGRSEAWANAQFSNAQRMRETLNALPATERTRHEYHRVINAYRRVYYGAPASAKADPSVVVVADLFAEMGRCFHTDNDLRSAISQYKFLRREYPGSRNRFQALFHIAQIYQDDLNEPAEAKLVFEEFLRRYPHNHLADAARGALAQPVQQAAQRSKASNPADAKHAAKESVREKEGAQKKDKDDESNDADDASNDATSDKAQAESHEGAAKPAHITNIRHWSSLNNTRVAIDLEQGAKFESQRIDNPERIFFDLLNTNVVSSLLGKTIDVDDGLLKKIRVAQFQPGKSRIVLEVADRSDYETFLLTSPPRLIIDIHNKDIPPQDSPDQVKSSERNPSRAQGVQAASMKQPAPLDSGNGRIADDAIRAKSEDSPSQEAKLPVAATIKSRVPIPRAPSVNGPRKTIVEADASDEDGTAKTAKLESPDLNSLQVKAPVKATSALTVTPSKTPARSKRKNSESFPDVREASPTANGDRSLIRALGLKIGKIVIDPGHGGHDTGTIGPNGLEEKDLVLDVGRRLGKLLQTRLGADVVYTRKDDTFIPLETRTSIANQEQADLFVSIHANSSRDADARGVETYYLNFTSSPEALDVAARENAASDKSIHELQDLVKKIALKEKIEESREFASNVQHALHSGLAAKSPGIRDRGVKKAPFVVLIGANMPSILAEISFVSNPGDERRLRTPDYRQRIAESLYRGISKYVSGLSGVKVAAKIDKSEGQ